MPAAKPPGFQDCHMPEVYYKMYREAAIHFHSTHCWLPLVPLWMWLPTRALWAACCKQSKLLLPWLGVANGQQRTVVPQSALQTCLQASR